MSYYRAGSPEKSTEAASLFGQGELREEYRGWQIETVTDAQGCGVYGMYGGSVRFGGYRKAFRDKAEALAWGREQVDRRPGPDDDGRRSPQRSEETPDGGGQAADAVGLSMRPYRAVQGARSAKHYAIADAGQVGAEQAVQGPYRVIVSVGASNVQAGRVGAIQGRLVGAAAIGCKRARCRGFSRKSRKRLRKLFGDLRREVVGKAIFMTLTYPAELEVSSEQSKRHLTAFWKRVARKFKGACCVWRLELQENGSPHFHLLVFGCKFIPYQWTARAWFEVVGSGLEKHLLAGTQTRRVKSYKESVRYMEKYLSKKEQLAGQDEEELGRLWGTRGDLSAVVAEKVAVPLDRAQYSRVCRALDNLLIAAMRRYGRKGRKRPHRLFRRQTWRCDTSALMGNLPKLL